MVKNAKHLLGTPEGKTQAVQYGSSRLLVVQLLFKVVKNAKHLLGTPGGKTQALYSVEVAVHIAYMLIDGRAQSDWRSPERIICMADQTNIVSEEGMHDPPSPI